MAIEKPGFTPPEQYTGSTLQLGPWTDIYALACTFYRMVTGKLPPEAAARRSGETVPYRSAGGHVRPCISRVHCAVKFDSAEGTVTIYDKSSNGVTLGDGRSLGGGSAVLSTDCMAALSEGEVILNIVINKNRGNVG